VRGVGGKLLRTIDDAPLFRNNHLNESFEERQKIFEDEIIKRVRTL
jgi:hypothetical protein